MKLKFHFGCHEYAVYLAHVNLFYFFFSEFSIEWWTISLFDFLLLCNLPINEMIAVLLCVQEKTFVRLVSRKFLLLC